MMKKFLYLIAVMFIIASDQFSAEVKQKLCPITGRQVNMDIYTDYQDKRVFFCSRGCEDRFFVKPEYYLKKMAADGDFPMKLKKQSLCPVMGDVINRKYFVDVKSKRIYICSSGCADKIRRNPAKYLRIIADNGEYPEDLKKESASLYCIPCL